MTPGRGRHALSQTFSLLRAARQGDSLQLCIALSALSPAWKPLQVLDLLTANCLAGIRPHLHGDTGCRALVAAGTCMMCSGGQAGRQSDSEGSGEDRTACSASDTSFNMQIFLQWQKPVALELQKDDHVETLKQAVQVTQASAGYATHAGAPGNMLTCLCRPGQTSQQMSRFSHTLGGCCMVTDCSAAVMSPQRPQSGCRCACAEAREALDHCCAALAELSSLATLMPAG